ncbi:HxlR family transcriptional regulator [Vulcanimicrobium alpinum]|uniref:HxlR family transcriptional regulator n=2 Tax=Vulcanimicrobium alpinum TaxID=3016050 RepID=A0AAN1XWA3_UNVUL|nr:HxlR family transcriptional regulator [Vulcanimicrobium alpinum]
MAKRRSFEGMNCSIARALDVVGEWWTLLVIREAFRGVRRFDGFVERLEIAPNILSARLRRLIEHEILEERPYSERPRRVEYRLTAKGRDLFPVIVALLGWGDRWYADDGPPVVLEHVTCGRRAEPRFVCTHCGERLHPRDTRAVPGRGAEEAEPSLAVTSSSA